MGEKISRPREEGVGDRPTTPKPGMTELFPTQGKQPVRRDSVMEDDSGAITIERLSAAFRGLPRDTKLFIRLPDGTELPIRGMDGQTTGKDGSYAGIEIGYRVVFRVEKAIEGGGEEWSPTVSKSDFASRSSRILS